MAKRISIDPQVAPVSPPGYGDVKVTGSLEFVQEFGGNESKPSYQEASGAPVETVSPLGLQVTWFTTIFLNIGQMIGTGVFSTPATILKGVGSVGLSLIFWFIGIIIAGSQLAVYTELASYFPNRSGAEVVYLEQAYPRPKYLLPTAFAVQSVLLSFSSSNCIVMAQYLYATGGYTPTAWELKGLAVACMTFVISLVIFNTKLSLRVSNTVGIIKIITLIFISITGLVVLGGHTRVKEPHANFHDAFSGTTGNGYGLSNALVKINFAYAGYTNAFNVVNELKNPIRTLKKTAPLSLLIVSILYMLCNIAYFAAVPKASLVKSNQLAASLFFSAVFGSAKASRGLNFLIAISAFGNITSVIIGSSRVIRECGRQGVLPYPKVWASTRPFGTPLAPYILKWSLTTLMILAPPAGDAFNFIVDLQSYPGNVFLFIMTSGLFIIRYRRSKLGIPRAEFRAWNVAIIFSLAVNIFILVMPWYPPPGGATGGDVSFWYATYCVVGLGILAICGIYYLFWIYILPHFGQYRIRQELVVLDDETAKTHRLVKVPLPELEAWDSEHDVLGNRVSNLPQSGSSLDEKSADTKEKEV
ncbi:amino acid transporter-like protein [Xylogone sp. PMI_703]|nr:amino acid transporter-like protein [Xylogone sp. PMI_703]